MTTLLTALVDIHAQTIVLIYIHLHFNYFEIFFSFSSFFSSSFTVIHSLRDVRVKIPSAVRKSDTVVLNCYYDMEGDSLYSVKWYKGKFLMFFRLFHVFLFLMWMELGGFGDVSLTYSSS